MSCPKGLSNLARCGDASDRDCMSRSSGAASVGMASNPKALHESRWAIRSVSERRAGWIDEVVCLLVRGFYG